jgi:hypothetical protein
VNVSNETLTEKIASVEAAVILGASISNACREVGISTQVYYRNCVTPLRKLKQLRNEKAASTRQPHPP